MQIFNEPAFARKPDVVVLDLDNTFYDYEEAHEAAMTAARNKACAVLGIGRADFEQAFAASRQDVKRRLGATASAHSRLLYFQRMIERLGMKTRVSLSLDLEQTYWRAFLVGCRLRPGALEFLMDVRSIGATTAILSDLTAQIQFRKIVFFGLEGLVDFVVTSEEVGVDKSGLRPFEVLKEKLRLSPSICVWMIGDDSCDMLAKDSIGAVTLFLSPGQQKPSRPAADAVFTSFADLSRFVGRWTKNGTT
jgi:putative hydrolase of the HAD superfamily